MASSEYAVKWDLLRDAALTGRTEEALVRIVVPIVDEVPNPDAIATEAAQTLIPEVERLLPVPE